jgi:SAM-dependent methyltransferase
MHASVRDWIAAQLPLIEGPRVIELGSLDVNGSVRPCVAVLKPAEYVGVDIRKGRGVDVVADVCTADLPSSHGQFDLVISVETLEHVQSWPLFVREMKRLCKPRGRMLMTCRSPGFALHDYPGDYWRFTVENIRAAFADCEVVDLREDPEAPGVFLHAVLPEGWAHAPLRQITVETPQQSQG